EKAKQALPDRDPLNCRDAVAQGYFVRQPDSVQYPIPGKLNVILAAAQIVTCFGLLTAASRAQSLWATALFAVLFAFIMQLGFSLAHEAAHSKLHARPNVNEVCGIFLFSLFPGSYHL